MIPSAERKPELPPPPAVYHEEAAAVADEMYGFLTTGLCFFAIRVFSLHMADLVGMHSFVLRNAVLGILEEYFSRNNVK